MNQSFSGKIAVVTGAGSGMGRCIARTLAEVTVTGVEFEARAHDQVERKRLVDGVEEAANSLAGERADADGANGIVLTALSMAAF